MPFKIGEYAFNSKLFLAPMAGITDRPYRDICRHYGAGLTVSEMITSDLSLLDTPKTKSRLISRDEPEPRSVQIVGNDPETMAKAALFNEKNGANIIDINMGCPAKKVCSKLAGSALMRDPKLVERILKAVVHAVDIPITLKIRTGWHHSHRNALNIAKIAEDCGVASLSIHGRTRDQAFTGFAEYETIRQIKQATSFPIIANGDIKNTQDAQFILDYTSADALMLGRVTQGQPWIFKEINKHLLGVSTKTATNTPITNKEKINTLLDHILAIHQHYGTRQGVRISRKHIGWYLIHLIGQKPLLLKELRKEIFAISDPKKQFDTLKTRISEALLM